MPLLLQLTRFCFLHYVFILCKVRLTSLVSRNGWTTAVNALPFRSLILQLVRTMRAKKSAVIRIFGKHCA